MASPGPSAPPAPKRQRRANGSPKKRNSASRESQKTHNAVSIMSGVPAGFSEPIPEFNPQATDAYFFAPIPPPQGVSEDAPAVSQADVGTSWLKEQASHWTSMPKCIEEGFELYGTRLATLMEATADLSATMTSSFREATKGMEKTKRGEESNANKRKDPYTALSTEHLSLKRELEKHRESMELIGATLALLTRSHTELVRRTRQSVRTVTVHTRLYPTFMPSTPGIGLLKDPFVNQ